MAEAAVGIEVICSPITITGLHYVYIVFKVSIYLYNKTADVNYHKYLAACSIIDFNSHYFSFNF